MRKIKIQLIGQDIVVLPYLAENQLFSKLRWKIYNVRNWQMVVFNQTCFKHFSFLAKFAHFSLRTFDVLTITKSGRKLFRVPTACTLCSLTYLVRWTKSDSQSPDDSWKSTKIRFRKYNRAFFTSPADSFLYNVHEILYFLSGSLLTFVVFL